MNDRVGLPNESQAHRAAREGLLQLELDLRRQMENVAAARRALPPGGLVPEDYVFQTIGRDGKPARVRLSELFARGLDTLILYNYMFPRRASDDRPAPGDGVFAGRALAETPCPSCTALLDALDGAAPHITQHANLAAVAQAPIERLTAWGQERGWRHLRLLSSAGNRFKRDYLALTPEGPLPLTTVFHRNDKQIRHFWSSELAFVPPDEGQDSRLNGTLDLLWNVLDLTPEGRPSNWYEQLSYGASTARVPPPR